jgi:hypothetical protein
VWWAYYQCEPFGSHWEQTASVAAMVSANTAMLAATRGAKIDAVSVLDLLPSDSMPWVKRTKRKAKGIRGGAGQAAVIKQAFGFR